MTKVAVLIGDSLLAEGMLSYLYQHAADVEFKSIDILSQNAVDQIREFRPDVLMLEGSSSQNLWMYLFALLKALPRLLIVCLYLQDYRIQLIQSEQVISSEANELVNIIQYSHLHQIQPQASAALRAATTG